MSLTASVKAFIISMDEESIAASTQAHIISLVSKKRRARIEREGEINGHWRY